MNPHARSVARFAVAALILTLPYLAFANSDRDIGPTPNMNRGAVNRWIVFFTNVERVKAGRLPLAYDPTLEKAADWIAEYCANKPGTISHDINEPGMQSFSDRVYHFGGKMSSGGENLNIIHRTNTEYVSFYPKQDGKGEYRDFGDFKVFWRNDRELAWKMVDQWMHSSGHYANIMGNFATLGAGSATGKYHGIDAAYGAQVFSSTKLIDFSALQWIPEKKQFSYSGKLNPTCFVVADDAQPVVLSIEKQGRVYRCNVGEGEKRIVFAGLYDAQDKITYPVVEVK